LSQNTITLCDNRSKTSILSVEGYSILVLEGPHEGLEISLDNDQTFIGRADWCDLCLEDDPLASNRHCQLIIGPDAVKVRDLDSRNGLYLDGNRISEAYLVPGNKFRIGHSVLLFRTNHRRRKLALYHFDATGSLIGKSPQMREIFRMLDKLSSRDTPVILTGETGTGKTSLAMSLHNQSKRKDGPLVIVNCGALPPSRIEADLFGHEAGAFTDAKNRHIGFFEQAHGGTLFLDEIGELPLELQPKLLDVLERKQLRRIGGKRDISVDFRLVTATHRNLVQESKKGQFREDLFYRLSVVELEVPPLRKRPEDIPLLIANILQELSPEQPFEFHTSTMEKLQRYVWPGNVRQLRNVLERSAIFLEGSIIYPDDIKLPTHDVSTLASPSSEIRLVVPKGDNGLNPSFFLNGETSLKDLMDNTERFALQKALEQNQWNVQKAAALLSISPTWLYRRMKKYGLKKGD